MNDRPDWLARAVAAHSATPSSWRQEEPTDVIEGDVLVVGAMDGEAPDCLVIAVDVDAQRRCFLAVRATNELPLAGADDVILGCEDTDLPYRVAALTCLVGHLWFVQVSRRVGALTENVAASVRAGLVGADDGFQRSRRGVPLQDPRSDLRWAALEAEANRMRVLAADCDRRRHDPLIALPFIDPEFLTGSRPETAMDPETFERLRNRTRRFSPSCIQWAVDNLSNQKLRAFRPLLATTAPAGPGGSSPEAAAGDPRPPLDPGAELLQRTIEDGLRDAPFVKIASATNSDEIHRPFEDRRAEIVYLAA